MLDDLRDAINEVAEGSANDAKVCRDNVVKFIKNKGLNNRLDHCHSNKQAEKFFGQLSDVEALNIWKIDIVNNKNNQKGVILIPSSNPTFAVNIAMSVCGDDESIPNNGKVDKVGKVKNSILFVIETFGFCKQFN